MSVIEKYLSDRASTQFSEDVKDAERKNTAPCAVCGKDKFVQLYRNVVGKVNGSMHGSFSLFGGSVTGYINGYTTTLPVLSCQNCSNERTIATYSYMDTNEMFWSDMHNLYFAFSNGEPERLKEFQQEQAWYLDKPYELHEHLQETYNWKFDFYHEMKSWPVKRFVEAGFDVPKAYKRFLFWTYETYPSWKELKVLTQNE